YLAALQVGQLTPVLIASLALGLFAWRAHRLSRLRAIWPLLLIGLAGCAPYIPVHMEARYVVEFIALFWFGIFLGLESPVALNGSAMMACTLLVCAPLLLLPMGQIYMKRANLRRTNQDAQAAAELATLGVKSGDKVGRISPIVLDLGIERIARLEVTAEVDFAHAEEFWSAPPDTQSTLLNLFASKGARAVIATIKPPMAEPPSGWKRLGSTKYWVWLPKSHG